MLEQIVIPNLEGQLAELRRRGQDPSTAICCAPSSGSKGANGVKLSIPGVAGCREYGRCIFGKKRFGGFKHTLPKMVPYFHQPDDPRLDPTEKQIPCYLFMRLVYPRMRAAEEARDEGVPAETIEILVENGKLATSIVESSGQVRVDDGRPGTPPVWESIKEPKPVHPYKYPSEMAKKSNTVVLDRRAARLARQQAIEDGEPMPVEAEDDAPEITDAILDMTETNPTPTRKGRATNAHGS